MFIHINHLRNYPHISTYQAVSPVQQYLYSACFLACFSIGLPNGFLAGAADQAFQMQLPQGTGDHATSDDFATRLTSPCCHGAMAKADFWQLKWPVTGFNVEDDMILQFGGKY